MHSNHFCFSNKTTADKKTLIDYCQSDDDKIKSKNMETKLDLNIIGKYSAISFSFII